jgi:hypothetical protein
MRDGASADCTCAETKEPVFFGERPAWGIASAYEILYVRTPCSLRNDSMLTIFPNVAMNPRTECFFHQETACPEAALPPSAAVKPNIASACVPHGIVEQSAVYDM